MKGHLVVMAKAPRIGAVKTRLARDIGLVGAWTFYRRTLYAITKRLFDPRWTCWLSTTPDGARLTARGWPPRWRRMPQGGGDLGTRLLRPFQTLGPGPVVIIGSDIPDIQPHHIAAAFKALGKNDVVFGPATDGGFWLIGARHQAALANPFHGVRWSTEHALADTLANLAKLNNGTRVGFVATLDDVDEAADLPKGAL